ncbi:hypothetical protein FACS189451_10420 [Bacteroidia bacterium]|nr:hypothetical protein FACS189446_6960 [Bacteroidia bacterium]GHT63551.1 hypothetical protein FACS189451_10420 [Bacteroidia bacterium]
MREKMKKMLFLMLFLLILGAASVISQVRIGGNGQPNPAAVLDLNVDNNATGTKGLALPRVNLTDINTALAGSPAVNGMLVYNTNASVTGGSGVGIYYWVTDKWIKVSDGLFTEVDGIIGNEVTGATTSGGLARAGSGTVASPYTLGIAANGVQTGMIADNAVTVSKLPSGSSSTTFLRGDGTWAAPTFVSWTATKTETMQTNGVTIIPPNFPDGCSWSNTIPQIANVGQGVSLLQIRGISEDGVTVKSRDAGTVMITVMFWCLR